MQRPKLPLVDLLRDVGSEHAADLAGILDHDLLDLGKVGSLAQHETHGIPPLQEEVQQVGTDGAQVLGQIAGKLSLQGRGNGGASKLLDNGGKEVLLVAKVAKEGDFVHASRGRQRAGSGPGIALFGKDLGSGPEDALAGVVHRGLRGRCRAPIIDCLRHLALP